MNWAAFAIVVGLAAAAWVWVPTRRKSGLRAGRWLAAPLLIVATLNAAAPVRGAIDPGYMGYVFGLLRASHGLEVTAIAGSLFVLSVMSARIAATRRSGAGLWIVALTCAGLFFALGVPTLIDAWRNPADNVIQLGEYLLIPGALGTALLLTIAAPFAAGAVWAARRAGREDPAIA